MSFQNATFGKTLPFKRLTTVSNLFIELCPGRGTAKAEFAQETPTQSHVLPSILVYEEKSNAHRYKSREWDV